MSKRSNAIPGGFSLVELLVAVLIVSILAAVAVPSYRQIMYKARASKVLADMSALRTATINYYTTNSSWPADVNWGVMPVELASFIGGADLDGEGFIIDYDNWMLASGRLVSISVVVDDPYLEAALVDNFGPGSSNFLHYGDRYRFILESPLGWP